jgi:hypothetical protein
MVHDIALRLALKEGDWPGLLIRTRWDAAPVLDASKTFIHPVKD